MMDVSIGMIPMDGWYNNSYIKGWFSKDENKGIYNMEWFFVNIVFENIEYWYWYNIDDIDFDPNEMLDLYNDCSDISFI